VDIIRTPETKEQTFHKTLLTFPSPMSPYKKFDIKSEISASSKNSLKSIQTLQDKNLQKTRLFDKKYLQMNSINPMITKLPGSLETK
jgi:hypothetical protein